MVWQKLGTWFLLFSLYCHVLGEYFELVSWKDWRDSSEGRWRWDDKIATKKGSITLGGFLSENQGFLGLQKLEESAEPTISKWLRVTRLCWAPSPQEVVGETHLRQLMSCFLSLPSPSISPQCWLQKIPYYYWPSTCVFCSVLFFGKTQNGSKPSSCNPAWLWSYRLLLLPRTM